MTPFQKRLQGSIPAIVTPLNEDFSVDSVGIRKVAARAIDHGSRGVVVVGTSGEFAGIDDDQRDVAVKAVVDEIGDRDRTAVTFFEHGGVDGRLHRAAKAHRLAYGQLRDM